MSIQPKTKFEELLGMLASFSNDRVLSEFELRRHLLSTRRLVDTDPVEAWHIQGLLYYFANDINQMKEAFNNSFRFGIDALVLKNAVACLTNSGQLIDAFNIFEKYQNYFLNTNKDYDLLKKLSGLALNLYDLSITEKIIEILSKNPEDQNLMKLKNDYILRDKDLMVNKLTIMGLEWGEANAIAVKAFETIIENNFRSTTLFQIREVDGEVFNTVGVYAEVSEVLKLNDILFDKIFESNLLGAWNKLMFIFAAEPKNTETAA